MHCNFFQSPNLKLHLASVNPPRSLRLLTKIWTQQETWDMNANCNLTSPFREGCLGGFYMCLVCDGPLHLGTMHLIGHCLNFKVQTTIRLVHAMSWSFRMSPNRCAPIVNQTGKFGSLWEKVLCTGSMFVEHLETWVTLREVLTCKKNPSNLGGILAIWGFCNFQDASDLCDSCNSEYR